MRRSPIPYGVVMATGAAAMLSAKGGLALFAEPLLMLTVAEAVGIPLVALLRRRTRRTPSAAVIARADPVTIFGLFSIPTGIAVLGVAAISVTGTRRCALALIGLGLAWLSLLALLGFLVARLVARHPGLTDVNGAWILVPAGILSTSILTSSVLIPASASWITLLAGRVALVGSGVGAILYVGLLVTAIVRVSEAGLGSHQSSWWIAAGCAGLAATATSEASRLAPPASSVRDALTWIGFAFWCLGSMLLVPLVIGSIRHLIVLHQPWGPSVWPPTFSTGAYALGTGQVAAMTHWTSLAALSAVAGAATLIVLACTIVGWFVRADRVSRRA